MRKFLTAAVVFMTALMFVSPAFADEPVDPDAWKKDGRIALYFGPGVATNIDKQTVDSEDSDAWVVDLGFLYEISRNVGIGLEMGHNSQDWSISKTQMVAIFRLAPNVQQGFGTYIKISGGGLTWDNDDDEVSTEFVWNLEPSFGVIWKPSATEPYSFFASTGPSLIFGAGTQQETVAAMQTRAGLAIEFGGQ